MDASESPIAANFAVRTTFFLMLKNEEKMHLNLQY